MLKIIIPVLFSIIGIASGAAVGYFVLPMPQSLERACDCSEESHSESGEAEGTDEEFSSLAFFPLSRQFMVPSINDGDVKGIVVLSLTLEAESSSSEVIYASEPELRDKFLELLFAYSNAGGFAKGFIQSNDLELLKKDLSAIAQEVVGATARRVLIVDLVYQDR